MSEAQGNQKTISEKNLDDLLEKALSYHSKGELARAEALYRGILEKNPRYFAALYNMTLLASDAGKYEIALLYANRAVKVEPASAEAMAMLGNALLGMAKYEEAAACFEKSVELNPHYTLAFYNLGVCQGKQRKYNQAIESYERALLIDPNDNDIYNNMGSIYEAKGLLNRASKCYYSALRLAPYEIKAVYNYVMCLFLMQRFREIRHFVNEVTHKSALSPSQLTGLYVLEAVLSLLENRPKESEVILNRIKNIEATEELFPNYNEFSAYCLYTERLVAYCVANASFYKKPYDKMVYLIGDSQCLPAANTVVRLGGDDYLCIPNLIMGAQARYLSEKDENKFKTAFRIAIDGIPNGGTFIAMFGVTDCQFDYGVLPYHKTIGDIDILSIKTTVSDIVSRYVDFTLGEAKKKKLNVIFYGVPAPVVQDKSHSWEDIELLKEIVKSFNGKLAQEALGNGCGFIDIYNITAAKDGVRQEKFFMDDRHIYPDVFTKACLIPFHGSD